MGASVEGGLRQPTSGRVDEVWSRALAKHNLADAMLVAQSPYDPFRRTYATGDSLTKIVLRGDRTSEQRACDLAGEYAVLQRCSAVVGVTEAKAFAQSEDAQILSLRYVDGRPLSEAGVGAFRFCRILVRLFVVLVRVSFRGVSHNDVLMENVIVSDDESVTLIDFDQATQASPPVALVRSVLGVRVGRGRVFGSLRSLAEQYLKQRLPAGMLSLVRRFRRRDA